MNSKTATSSNLTHSTISSPLPPIIIDDASPSVG
ncbi:hypothetical protein ACHAWT_001429 [Skeletonema menzelii]